MAVDAETIRQCLLDLVQQRGPEKSICPSEVARSLDPENWRSLMPQVRSVGIELADAKHITVTQKGVPVNPRMARGPIRYRRQIPPPLT